MIFNFVPSEGIGMLSAFAEAIGSKLENGIVELPEYLGKGYIRGLDLGPRIRVMIRQYELNEDLVFKRSATTNGEKVVVMAFHNFFSREPGLPFVQITSTGLDYEDFFPIHSKINSILISVQVSLLKELLYVQEEATLLDSMMNRDQPFLYEEIISPQMQELTRELVRTEISGQLRNFFYRLKAEELIYLLFTELLKRRELAAQSLNIVDVKTIYQVKDKIIVHINRPPRLDELSKFAGMSESKLKRLFKQIFGKNIYDYYQYYRMNEAASLLKEKGLTVAETGYELGFSNLSHFARVFEKYIGLKPKKYALEGKKIEKS